LFESLKLLLWKIDLYPDRCPFCNSRLVMVGFLHDICFQDYIYLREGRRFNKRK